MLRKRPSVACRTFNSYARFFPSWLFSDCSGEIAVSFKDHFFYQVLFYGDLCNRLRLVFLSCQTLHLQPFWFFFARWLCVWWWRGNRSETRFFNDPSMFWFTVTSPSFAIAAITKTCLAFALLLLFNAIVLMRLSYEWQRLRMIFQTFKNWMWWISTIFSYPFSWRLW